jgi:hypothetical protein
MYTLSIGRSADDCGWGVSDGMFHRKLEDQV